MSVLDSKLRSQLDSVCQKAREKAEEAALSALQKRAVDAAEPHPHFTAAEKKLRNRLRARGRQAGDVRQTNKTQGIEQLAQELAYESWHRMLFARFLAENHLLMHPDGVAVSLEDCEELAPDASPPAPNGFVLAARYASRMLPQVFRIDDVLLEIEFAPEHRLALEKLLAGLPKETFMADDSLGWVYQFWQSKRKEEVNKSGEKIDGRTLSAVTQLFTEDYMVQFLLHNTIGAWWCARHGINGPAGGAGVSSGEAPVEMPYLRWRDDGTPAAGTFDGWPKTLEEFKLLDPCCGSGHFLVAAFNILVPLRMHDEGLTKREACDAVLRENLSGLELDPRCTQIAAFALAVAAWKYPGEDGQPLGYRELPSLNIACAGIGPQATEEEWLKLAEQSGKKMSALSREPILNGLRNLHALFSDAPTLGSLIDPNQLSADLITADYETLQPYLAAALTAEQADDDTHERAVAAAGMVKAAELLAGEYTLVVTNVPFLGMNRQDSALFEFLKSHYLSAKADLATAFIQRCLECCCTGGTAGIVSPQIWLFLGSYKVFRTNLLKDRTWNLIARLGPGAFTAISGEVVNVGLFVLSEATPTQSHLISGLDVSGNGMAQGKATKLECDPLVTISQIGQLKNPDARVTLEGTTDVPLLMKYADSYWGIGSGDIPRFACQFWEFQEITTDWKPLHVTSARTCEYTGHEQVIDWRKSRLELCVHEYERDLWLANRWNRGSEGWGKKGVAISQMGGLAATLFSGGIYQNGVAAIIPKNPDHLSAVWAFCSSDSFCTEVRRIDKKLSVTNLTLIKVPFDLTHWQKVAAEKYPHGLPKPFSSDPTQWLFNGYPQGSDQPLHVAVARLLGYQWPRQVGSSFPDCPALDADGLEKLADDDGIVCIPATRTESPAADRILELLRASYGSQWSNSLMNDLLVNAGCKPGTTLEDWLRNAFFEQHCKLFHHRPFIWQFWDGRKDGFSCLVNYHRLNYKTLDNLTHSYLEGWIKKQAGDAKTGKTGADLRLAAAQALQEKLKLILAGEPPYDIFVRWKPLHEQPIGWNPDPNDGVRMNIRPFVEAGVLRKNPNIKWTKDRGKEPEPDKDDFPWFWDGKVFVGERVNDIHVTNAEKQAARDRRGQ